MASAEQDPAADNRRQQAIVDRVRDRIEGARREREMPKSRLAELIGKSRSQLYKLLDGETPWSSDNLTAVERALQLPHGELLRLAGKPAPVLPGGASPVSVAIISASELDQYEKEALLRVYESFMANKRRDE